MSKPVEQINVVFIGNSFVGKTSIINRYKEHDSDVSPTIGAEYSNFVMTIKGKSTNICITDTSGQINYRSLIPLYVKNASVAVIVASIDDRSSIDSIVDWDKALMKHAPEEVMKIIVINKIDKASQVEGVDEIFEKVILIQHEITAAEVFHTSAITGQGVDALFSYFIDNEEIIRDKNFMNDLTESEKIDLTQSNENSSMFSWLFDYLPSFC